MDLYLIRHADAAALGELGITEDADRPLTDQGKEQVQRLAEALERLSVRPAVVLTSPLLRARQTAEGLIAHRSDAPPQMIECQPLAPGGKRRRIARTLRDLTVGPVVLVGHEPDLGQLASWLCGSRRAQIEFGKGSVAYLRGGDSPGKGFATLVWLITQDWLSAWRTEREPVPSEAHQGGVDQMAAAPGQ